MLLRKIGILILLVAAGIIIWSLQRNSIHDFKDKCFRCHVGMKDPKILTQEVDNLCLSCHPETQKLSHPSNLYPGKKVPTEFPVFHGKMVCITCHVPHPKYNPDTQMLMENDSVRPFLLRSEKTGKFFCLLCHQNGLSDFQESSHALTIRRAHSIPDPSKLKRSIDDHSRECLSCHDGTLSIEAETSLGEVNWEHKNLGVSHPINIDYAEVYRNNPNFYHPPERLDPRIILINGKIGCETCHNHYSKIKKRLVMENFRSKLCLSCHNI